MKSPLYLSVCLTAHSFIPPSFPHWIVYSASIPLFRLRNSHIIYTILSSAIYLSYTPHISIHPSNISIHSIISSTLLSPIIIDRIHILLSHIFLPLYPLLSFLLIPYIIHSSSLFYSLSLLPPSSLPTRPSRLSVFLARRCAKIALCLNGSVIRLITRSDITLRDVTGDALSSVSKWPFYPCLSIYSWLTN
jgi:hypothetical protein